MLFLLFVYSQTKADRHMEWPTGVGGYYIGVSLLDYIKMKRRAIHYKSLSAVSSVLLRSLLANKLSTVRTLFNCIHVREKYDTMIDTRNR